MDMTYAVSKMWEAAKSCIEELNGDIEKECSMTFFGLLDACKKKMPDVAIQADLEDFNLGEALFYAFIRKWNMAYRTDVFYADRFSSIAYNLICHLFEEEDFTLVFTSTASLLNAILSLHSNECDACKYSDEFANDFYRLYNIIAKRTSVSVK